MFCLVIDIVIKSILSAHEQLTNVFREQVGIIDHWWLLPLQFEGDIMLQLLQTPGLWHITGWKAETTLDR